MITFYITMHGFDVLLDGRRIGFLTSNGFALELGAAQRRLHLTRAHLLTIANKTKDVFQAL